MMSALEFAALVDEEAQIAEAAAAMFAAGRDDPFAGGTDGWFGVGLPEDLGGAGGGMSDLAPVLEAAGAATAATCLPWTTGIVGRLLVGAGGAAGQFVARIAGGDVAACVPALGCARAAAEPGSDGRVSATMLALGPATGTLALPLLADGEPRLVLVGTDDDGVTAESVPGMDITRPWTRFTLDGVRTGSLPQISSPDLFLRWQAATGTVFGLDSAGAARTALRTTVDHAGTRHQFGRALASFQAYKHLCASALVELKLAQSVAYRAARSDSDGLVFALSAAVQATASATSVSADAVQLHGGIGFSWESGVHRYLRRCRANEILAGGEHVERALLDTALAAEG